MCMTLEAACCCSNGKVRRNNEDNFFFDDRILPEDNSGLDHALIMEKPLWNGELIGVFDGMGGEQFGEVASFAAADCMRQKQNIVKRRFAFSVSRMRDLCSCMNEAVLQKQLEYCNDRMGTTVVSVLFKYKTAYIMNLGDSRAYRVREGIITQLSKDHVEKYKGNPGKKPPLTQHLGIEDEEFVIQPYLLKERMRTDDRYILCSDGLYDMLSEVEILKTVTENDSCKSAAEQLLECALDMGGKDNITIVVCHVF